MYLQARSVPESQYLDYDRSHTYTHMNDHPAVSMNPKQRGRATEKRKGTRAREDAAQRPCHSTQLTCGTPEAEPHELGVALE